MNRREFLNIVAGLGVSVAYPWAALADANDEVINQEWPHIEKSPLVFELIYDQTLAIADLPEPECRFDVFDLTSSCIDSPKSLAMDIESCQPLAWHVGRFCEEERENVMQALEEQLIELDMDNTAREAAIAKAELAWPDPCDPYGLAEWTKTLDADTFKRLAESVSQWLDDPPDWNESEYFSSYADGQSAALSFFRCQPDSVLDALNVVIVEGEHPGSSYYAAELRASPDEANQAAVELNIPIRFLAV